MPLVYKNPNHAQDAQFETTEGKSIVGFTARIDGVTPPVYSMYLQGTIAEYQDNSAAIFTAYIAFLQTQVKVERTMVANLIALRPEVVTEETV